MTKMYSTRPLQVLLFSDHISLNGPSRIRRLHRLHINQSINQSIIYLVMQVYRVAAIRLMWTYNELMKYKTKIT